MKKRIAPLLLLLALSLFLCSCGTRYDEDDFIGKTSLEIEAEFGKFDCTGRDAGADRLYTNTACGYTIREPRVRFLGTDPEWLFFISFDENGVADSCYEGYRPGG
ncbi:MAG: hypothetical protein J6Q72_04415 [Clostridia bacterium]|nr:hypothetical protein [Clostridia bacterium]